MLITSALKLCIHHSRSLFLYINVLFELPKLLVHDIIKFYICAWCFFFISLICLTSVWWLVLFVFLDLQAQFHIASTAQAKGWQRRFPLWMVHQPLHALDSKKYNSYMFMHYIEMCSVHDIWRSLARYLYFVSIVIQLVLCI